ncbi:MAG TPA: UDP-N-acetylmuramate--L-alanine ligase [Chlamydiales bacterium]|nr:UDP-N-acetylmuramate--L-alanine ligase [Chlamydiales bacterium]
MKYHLIGLGGIGMSALARILIQKGHQVQGSDAALSPLLTELQSEGISIQVGHQAEAIHPGTTVVYSSAVKDSNVEVVRAKELKLPLLHRSDLLDQLMKGKKNLLVTGTHGKTTTTALLTAVFLEANLDPSFVIGGILNSLKTNGKAGNGGYFIAEADESDGSFLKTVPFGAIVTNLENDHLDYWGSEEKLDGAFQQFFGLAKDSKNLFWCGDDARLSKLQPKGISYGFSEKAQLRITSFHQTEQGICFDLNEHTDIALSLLGRHNALNGAAVFGLALSLNIPEEAIRRAFAKFSGTQRRLEKKGEAHKVALYDDYGHHPTEIAATLQALRDHVRERRLVAVFQPHRFTRVRDLFEEYLHCFSQADEVVLTDIYSAGEAPIEGITSAALYTKMREKLGARLHFFPRQHLEAGVAQILKPLDVVLTIGAGDVTRAGEPILKQYAERAPKIAVGVICGGTSAEHPVSLMSTRQITQAMDPSVYEIKLFGITKEGDWLAGSDVIEKLENKIRLNGTRLTPDILQELLKCDVFLPVLHGPQGEDGMIPGLLDTLQIPYAGCDYRSGAICMQKSWAKQIALLHNVPTPPYFEMDIVSYRKDPSQLLRKIEKELSYPVWIKPVHLGSSIGVYRVNSSQEASKRAEDAFYYDDVVIVEKHIEGRQIEFAILGNEYIRTALPLEILVKGEFHDYESKYGANASPVLIPPSIPELDQKLGKELAEKVYRILGCKGLARVDFFFDRKGHFWFNEINPFPGFTPTSAFPQMWEASGVSRGQINDEMIALAMQRSRRLTEIRGH